MQAHFEASLERCSPTLRVRAHLLHMVSYVECSIDERFKDVFVVSYRAFITADALLDHLIQEYHYAETDSTLGAYAVTRQIAYVFQPHSRGSPLTLSPVF
jgi:hypothetical protein